MSEQIVKTLYDGAVEIVFYPESHRYKIKGERSYLISVTAATGIIDKSRFLIPWAVNLATGHIRQYLETAAGPFSPEELAPIIDEAAKQHQIKKEEAASIGGQVHDWAESFALAVGTQTNMPRIPEEADGRVIKGINAFLDWYTQNNVVFRTTEQLVYSQKHDYVGHLDAIAEVNGVLTVIDYKTGKGIYNEAYYQIAAYWAAHEEQYGEKVGQAVILHFDKETGAFNSHLVTVEDHTNNLPVFLSCLCIKRREKELIKY